MKTLENAIAKRKIGDYCTGQKDNGDFVCSFRRHKITNKGGFCELGYTQNPKTRKATINLLSCGGKVCRFNPF